MPEMVVAAGAPGNGSRAIGDPGDLAARWIERFLVHAAGDRQGQPFLVHPFQRDLLSELLRTDPSGRRVIRRALIGMPKGCGKTELAAAIAILVAASPLAPPSPDVIVVAASLDQAGILFDAVKAMISGGPLASYFDLFEHEVVRRDAPGRIRRIAANFSTADGLRPTAAIFDELHEFVTPSTVRTHLVVANGLVKRADGFELGITTAGASMDSLVGRLYATGIAGTDPAFLCRWWTAVEGHDLDDDAGLRAALREANPAVDAGFLDIERLVARYREVPQHEFRRYYLNQWAARPDQAMPDELWAACADPDRGIDPGTEIVLALDASFRRDSTALLGVTYEPRPHVFVVDIWEQPEGDDAWRVPTAEVMAAIVGTARYCVVLEIVHDPTFGWTGLLGDLEQYGLTERLTEWPTSSAPRIGPAWLHFRDAVHDGGLTHDGDDRLARHVANLVLRADRYGERPTRDRSQPRSFIDAAITAIVGYDRATHQEVIP